MWKERRGSTREDELNCGELPSLDKLIYFKKHEKYFLHAGKVKQDNSFSKVFDCGIHTSMYVQVIDGPKQIRGMGDRKRNEDKSRQE